MRGLLAALVVIGSLLALFRTPPPAAAAECVGREYTDAAGDVATLDVVAYATRTCGGWENSDVTFSVQTGGYWREEDLGEFVVLISDRRPGTGCAERDDLDTVVTVYYDAGSGGLVAEGVQYATCNDQLGIPAAVTRAGADRVSVTLDGGVLGRAPEAHFRMALGPAGSDNADWMPEAGAPLPLVARFVGPPRSYAGARPIDNACPPGLVRPAGFADIAGDAHRDAIDCIAWWGVARGVTATAFAPHTRVTRGQMATFLARLIDASETVLPPAAADRFTDDDGRPHEAAINRLAAVGIVGGYPDGRFGADDGVTRGQMATFLARTYRYIAGGPLGAAGDAFGDDRGSAHEAAINQVAAAGIAAGVAPGRYEPAAPVRRDQMASFVARLLDVVAAQGWARSPLLSGTG